MGQGLYYTLYTETIKDKPLTKKEITSLEKITNFSEKEAQAALDIIKTFCLEHLPERDEFTIPFKGVQQDIGIEFNIKNIPPVLGRVLLKFIDLVEK